MTQNGRVNSYTIPKKYKKQRKNDGIDYGELKCSD